VRAAGAFRSENVGMSNHNPNEKLEPRKSKVSVALAINHGLGGPKAMAKAAVDGKLVNIPARPRNYNCVTKEISRRALLVWHRLSQVQAEIDGRSGIYLADDCEEPSEKSSANCVRGLRTVNRHRWIGREDLGERVIHL
jgi:hypothetical protein